MTPETANQGANGKRGKFRAKGAGKPDLYDEVTGRIIAELEFRFLPLNPLRI